MQTVTKMKKHYLTNSEFSGLESFIKDIPNFFNSTGKVIKNDRNELRIIEYQGIKFVIKSYKKITLANRFIYKFFRKSKAQRAYEYALHLKNKNIKTPTPIGFIDLYSNFKLKSSYFISLYVENSSVLSAIKSTDSKTQEIALLNKLAEFIYHAHNNHIFHKDLNMDNIIYVQNGDKEQFYLIDNNRMSFKKPTLSARVNNLKYINLPVEQYAILMAQYAKFMENPHHVLHKILLTREKQVISRSFVKTIKKPIKRAAAILG